MEELVSTPTAAMEDAPALMDAVSVTGSPVGVSSPPPSAPATTPSVSPSVSPMTTPLRESAVMLPPLRWLPQARPRPSTAGPRSALDATLTKTARGAPAAKAAKPVNASRIRAQQLRRELLQSKLDRQDQMTPTQRLLLAADAGDVDLLERVLNETGLDVNTADDHGRTALHFAACAGHPAIVHILIAHGCDLNVRDVNQNTPLHLAVISTHIPVVTALLRGGANLNVDNVCRSTPIEAAKSKLRMMRMHSPDRDMEGADELFEVLDMLLVYAEHAHARQPGSLDLGELRARLEGIPTLQDKFDAVELALNQLALL